MLLLLCCPNCYGSNERICIDMPPSNPKNMNRTNLNRPNVDDRSHAIVDTLWPKLQLSPKKKCRASLPTPNTPNSHGGGATTQGPSQEAGGALFRVFSLAHAEGYWRPSASYTAAKRCPIDGTCASGPTARDFRPEDTGSCHAGFQGPITNVPELTALLMISSRPKPVQVSR